MSIGTCPSLWQRFQSLFYPVSILKSSSPYNPRLELFYYQGRHVLATADAVYSDGHKYRPLVAAFFSPRLASCLRNIQAVLVLGTGLASAAHVLARKGLYPRFTFVDIDPVVLQWAGAFLPEPLPHKPQFIEADAFDFVEGDAGSYDIIVVDIFFGRDVPARVTELSFLESCKRHLSSGGHLVLNYMQRKDEGPDVAKAALGAVFSEVTEISFGLNKVYTAS